MQNTSFSIFCFVFFIFCEFCLGLLSRNLGVESERVRGTKKQKETPTPLTRWNPPLWLFSSLLRLFLPETPTSETMKTSLSPSTSCLGFQGYHKEWRKH
ncbi:hypothetical protein QJS04_geneDACA001725 [Acorus gramineus]|uniref:Secreted protein n=1 Tax=Acorus gramineus TaxID=55184 RepID=A0AAV9BEU9_ACOGR|nr:hypothetical protein QJS04_geneDACA001725 [Acorus gramineus]